ncbi:hypothetical protein E2C01_043185 [Portunus trituberculatus]|uniref:Uncharacterized protein n=1 Tax=Portunus trituberculatus TaxID=210409 RepID=A0A5B7FV10_PORTR|nr:hypothetical protein [Portunus trituberculatus]
MSNHAVATISCLLLQHILSVFSVLEEILFDRGAEFTNDVLPEGRDFNPYSSSAEWADKNKTSLSALSEVDAEGPALAGSARFNGLKKEDIEEGPAVAGSAGVIGMACLTGLKNE